MFISLFSRFGPPRIWLCVPPVYYYYYIDISILLLPPIPVSPTYMACSPYRRLALSVCALVRTCICGPEKFWQKLSGAGKMGNLFVEIDGAD